MFDTSFKGETFSPPPPNAENMTHFQYFQRFWDNEIHKYLTEKTNLHLKHETGKSIIVTEDEIDRMSQHEMHWPPELLFDKIRSALTLKRYIY